MKPRPLKVTTDFGRTDRPPVEGWPEKTNPFDDPEDKTPIAPAPSRAMLAVAGAPWFIRHRYLLVGVGCAAMISVALIIGLRASAPAAPVPPPAPLILAAPAAPAAPAGPETVVVSVTVAPATAQVLIDGQVMPSNPFMTRFPRGTATHRLRAVAPGYQPKERWVSFADNVMLDISLTPLPADGPRTPPRRHDPPPVRRPPPPAPPPVPAAVHHPPPADITPRPETDKPHRRPIEATDPYAGDR